MWKEGHSEHSKYRERNQLSNLNTYLCGNNKKNIFKLLQNRFTSIVNEMVANYHMLNFSMAYLKDPLSFSFECQENYEWYVT
jgi:hypothetical protein